MAEIPGQAPVTTIPIESIEFGFSTLVLALLQAKDFMFFAAETDGSPSCSKQPHDNGVGSQHFTGQDRARCCS